MEMMEKCVNMINQETDKKIEIDYSKISKLCEDY